MIYTFKPQAFRQLEKLPRDIKKRIIKKLDFYSVQDNPLKFAEPLIEKRLGSYRFRIGDYRVIFDVEKDKIVVLLVGHRKEIYH